MNPVRWSFRLSLLLVACITCTTALLYPVTEGRWSTWTDWSVCSASCDAGVRFRGRHCENGTDCIGQVFEQQPCTIKSCVQAIDGSWGSWGTLSQCSVTCGIGYTYRLRVCDSPAPSGGGADCAGTNRDFQECNLGVCQLPVDGGWTDFVDHDCSVSCGVGVVVSTRSCTNPAPAYGGKNCEGSSTAFKKCVNNLCVQDGGWSDWTNYTDCGVICGFGLQRRERSCTNPAPASGGKYCEGIGLEEQECFKGDCPPDIKTCDKTMLRKALTNATTSCPPSNNADDSIVRSFCVVPDNQISWRFGLEIHNNCEMIPLYSPVGAVQAGTAHVKKFGLMVDCYRTTLSMAITNCNNDIVVEKQNLTDTSTTYHMILFS
ncbi:coadhesin-like isoform X2 [Mya arenaria]|uniref:coadhesin-like isoform X2 n=1 Tax=Mya arenaria TaxID=6604 RepID=UPI0022E3D1DD|nr:coadhesin-like isoform X2 [Mya arenaria]